MAAAAAFGAFAALASSSALSIVSRALPDGSICPDPPNCEGSIKLPTETVTVNTNLGLFRGIGKILSKAIGAIGRWLQKIWPRILSGLKKFGAVAKAGGKALWETSKSAVNKIKNIFRGDPKITINTEHAARPGHFPNGIDVSQVEGAITKSVNSVIRRTNISGEFWGRVNVNGTIIEYRAFTLPNGTINVGTYYPIVP